MIQPLGYFDCSQCGDKHPVYQDPQAKNRLLLPTTCSRGVPNQPTPNQATELEEIEEGTLELVEDIFKKVHQRHWSEALLQLDELLSEQNKLHKLICLIRGDKK